LKDFRKNIKKGSSVYSKLSEKEKESIREFSNLINSKKENLTFEDLIYFEKLKETVTPIKEKHGLDIDNLFDLVKEELFLPVELFNKKLTVLETVVKYLKENKEFNFHKISELINRDERNIWHIYNSSKKKSFSLFVIKESKINIPISIFTNSRLSALESIVVYLKEKSMFSYKEIAVLLKRDARTIWTVYNRARKKNVK
jgi:RNAse (barnase) inhibitor barstar